MPCEHHGRSVADVERGWRPHAAAADSRARGGLLEIEPRAEAAAGAGQHDDAHLGVRLELEELLREQLEHRDGDGVQPFGTVQGEGADGTILLDQ